MWTNEDDVDMRGTVSLSDTDVGCAFRMGKDGIEYRAGEVGEPGFGLSFDLWFDGVDGIIGDSSEIENKFDNGRFICDFLLGDGEPDPGTADKDCFRSKEREGDDPPKDLDRVDLLLEGMVVTSSAVGCVGGFLKAGKGVEDVAD